MKKILVIRNFDVFSRILRENNFEVLNLPLIETRALKNLSDFDAKLETVENYDGIFLTSKQAAQILAKKLREKHLRFVGKVYVLGKSGFEVLKNENLDLVFLESANTAREMLENISSADLKDKRFLFTRGEKSLRVVPEFLEEFSQVDETVVYETRKISIDIDEINALRTKFEKGEIAAACFFSPSAAKNFLEQFSALVLHQTCIATIGKTTADFFEQRNLKVSFVSSKAAAEDFAAGLTEYLNKENQSRNNTKKHEN